MFSNYPFEMSRLLFTMLFSPHGWAPPISWHMCNILRSPCLPFASHVPKVSEKEKSAIHEVYTPNLEREISNHRGLHNFYVTSFPSRGYHRHLDVILRNRRRARFEKKKIKRTSIRLPRLEKRRDRNSIPFYERYEAKKRPFHIHALV